MFRKHMTEAQFEMLKREQSRMHYMDTRMVEDVFPDIESIVITYHLHHGSAFGNQDKECTWTVNMKF